MIHFYAICEFFSYIFIGTDTGIIFFFQKSHVEASSSSPHNDDTSTSYYDVEFVNVKEETTVKAEPEDAQFEGSGMDSCLEQVNTIYYVPHMHDIPAPTDPNTHLMSYADDLTVTQQHPKHETSAANLQVYINQLEDWLTTNRLKVSPNKSSLTLITPYKKEIADQPALGLVLLQGVWGWG